MATSKSGKQPAVKEPQVAAPVKANEEEPVATAPETEPELPPATIPMMEPEPEAEKVQVTHPVVRKLNTIVTEEPEVEWIKTSGSFYFKGKCYGPGKPDGNRFSAKPSEIPMTFRDTIRPIQELPNAAATIDFVPTGYKAVPAPQEGYFDIVNGQGVRLNGKPLSRTEAEATIKRLQ